MFPAAVAAENSEQFSFGIKLICANNSLVSGSEQIPHRKGLKAYKAYKARPVPPAMASPLHRSTRFRNVVR